MSYNTNRRYTVEEIADLTALAAEAHQLDADVRAVMAELDDLLTSHGAYFPGWEAYYPELQPVIDALDVDKHPFQTANTSYIPQVGHYWNSKWNPTTWRQRNNQTRRDIANLRKAIEACGSIDADRLAEERAKRQAWEKACAMPRTRIAQA